MNNKIKNILIILFSQIYVLYALAHGAHVHGVGQMTIAIETPTKANVDFLVPTDSIFGFEHDAVSTKDKKTKKDALDKINSQAQSIVQFDSAAACKSTIKKLATEPEKDDDDDDDKDQGRHGKHQNLSLNLEVQCAKSLAGTHVSMGIMKLFPRLQTVKLQILTDKGQTAKDIKAASESVEVYAK